MQLERTEKRKVGMLALNLPSTLADLARTAKRLPPVAAAFPLAVAFLLSGPIVTPSAVIMALGLALGPDRVAALISGTASDLAGEPILGGLAAAGVLVLSFAPALLTTWLWVRFFEKRPFWTLGFVSAAWFLKYARGFVIGAAFFAMMAGALALSGQLVRGQGGAASAGFAGVLGSFVVLAGWVIQGAVEEVVARGWLMNVVAARMRLWAGVLGSVIFFAFMHGFNPGIGPLALINLALFALFASLFAVREGSLWGVCAFHSAWNWMQGNVFGLSVSGGGESGPTLFRFGLSGSALWTGGAFGPEGGLMVTLLLLAAVLAVLLWRKNRRSAE